MLTGIRFWAQPLWWQVAFLGWFVVVAIVLGWRVERWCEGKEKGKDEGIDRDL